MKFEIGYPIALTGLVCALFFVAMSFVQQKHAERINGTQIQSSTAVVLARP